MRDSESPTPNSKLQTLLSTENIYASYYKKEVLRGVSITVKSGEIVSLIGPNGAGKSTLLKVIIGILPQKRGRVFLNHKEISGIPTYLRVKKGMGYLIQGGEVFSNLSVFENLELGGYDLSSDTLKERLDEIFTLFPILNKNKFKRAGFLSGGERQQLALGIVLIKRPSLLLLDEPSAGLAPILVKDISDKIREINRVTGTSILLVEQNIKEALRISNRVYLLKNGEIVGEEEPKKVLEERKLEKIFFT